MASLTDVAERALDKVRPPKGVAVPSEVDVRVKRGRGGLQTVTARRREAVEFTRNNHYVTIDKSGLTITQQSVVAKSKGGEKPDHRVRRSHDILAPILQGKVSAATQRIPGYEVMESTSDPEDYSAARVSEKVLDSGYELWNFKEGFRRAVWLALVTEEAFLMPYWDSSVGPYVTVEPENEGEEPRKLGMGEIKLGVYSGLEVSWEPGVQFNDSRWYSIDHARPKDQVESEQGYIGGELTADADTSIIGQAKKTKSDNLVMVTEYLERPCPKWPNGRRIIYAGKQQLFAEEDYPLRDQDGNVVDAPCLHRLYYMIDGVSERARGLVGAVVETIRNYDYASNKAAEFLQLALVPQMIAPEGAIKGAITDEPGSVVEVDEDALGKVQWREMPSMPQEFNNERNRSEAQLGYITNSNQVPSQVESGKGIGALAQKDALAWEDFIEELAGVHARVARDSLCLVQQLYSEQRMVKFRGRTGWEAIADFRGADIRGQTDVRVQPGSLEPLTRAVIEQRIMNVAQMFPGYFSPEVLLAALSSGNFDRLNETYEEDEQRVNFLIAQIRAGTFWKLPKRRVMPGENAPELDPVTGKIKWAVAPEYDEHGQPVPGTGQPVMLTMIEGWMPRPFDGIAVHKRRIETFMKSDEWRNLDEEAQSATAVYYEALLQLEAKKVQRDAIIQNQTAEQLGKANAARPQLPSPLPSLPAVAENGNGAELAPAAQ